MRNPPYRIQPAHSGRAGQRRVCAQAIERVRWPTARHRALEPSRWRGRRPQASSGGAPGRPRAPQAARHEPALGEIERRLRRERQQRRRDRALEDERHRREPHACQDRLTVAARAHERAERRGPHRDHRRRLHAGEDRGRRERQLDEPQPRARREPERLRGLAQLRGRSRRDPRACSARSAGARTGRAPRPPAAPRCRGAGSSSRAARARGRSARRRPRRARARPAAGGARPATPSGTASGDRRDERDADEREVLAGAAEDARRTVPPPRGRRSRPPSASRRNSLATRGRRDPVELRARVHRDHRAASIRPSSRRIAAERGGARRARSSR